MAFFDKYPYSNLHNVNLDWVLERVKEWGQMVEDNNTRFENLEQANEDFKAYVTNYIENLDYQSAIDDKLDRMFESGVLGEYLQPYVSPVVTTWLGEHITEPTGVVIDTSLTVAGACADAKATGLALGKVKGIAELFGFSDISKQALLDCFVNVAWINGNGSLFFNALQSSFNMGWNNKAHWSLTDGLQVNIGNMVTEYFPLLVTNITSVNRGLITCNKGLGYYYNYNSGNLIPTDPKRYPLPIPFGAKRFKIQTERGFGIVMNVWQYLGENEYAIVQQFSQITSSSNVGQEFTLDLNVSGLNLYLTILILTSQSALPNRVVLDFEF